MLDAMKRDGLFGIVDKVEDYNIQIEEDAKNRAVNIPYQFYNYYPSNIFHWQIRDLAQQQNILTENKLFIERLSPQRLAEIRPQLESLLKEKQNEIDSEIINFTSIEDLNNALALLRSLKAEYDRQIEERKRIIEKIKEYETALVEQFKNNDDSTYTFSKDTFYDNLLKKDIGELKTILQQIRAC